MAEKVLLRIKRKRTDEPVEHLAVQSQLILPKKVKLEDALNALSLAKDNRDAKNDQSSTAETSVFVFTRIDTVSSTTDEKKVHRRLEKSIQRHHNDLHKNTRRNERTTREQQDQQRKQKRSDRVLQSRGLNLVDVTLQGSSTLQVTVDDVIVKRKNRVLNPMERSIDEAVWIAFQRNDFSHFFRVKNEIASPVEFQRPADGGTILMAAAMNNRVDVIEKLFALKPESVLLRDWNGKTAADIATSQGHVAAATALRACEAMEMDKDYVYDVYSIDMTATNDRATVENVPVVAVSTSVERWLTLEAFGDLDSEDRELVHDVDSSDNEDILEDDVDSNDEGHIFNDYPDEEESDANSDEEFHRNWEQQYRPGSDSDPWTTHQEFADEGDY
ncbi:unnamed protein product [Aphanomyces euteiches]|nr:hypothetical protein Ae201684P_018934 [Aphanomyces euteiches]